MLKKKCVYAFHCILPAMQKFTKICYSVQEYATACKIMEKYAKVCENMQKYAKTGTQLYVEGELETRQFKDSNDQNRIVTEVVIPRYTGSIRLVGDKPASKSVSTDDSAGDFDNQF